MRGDIRQRARALITLVTAWAMVALLLAPAAVASHTEGVYHYLEPFAGSFGEGPATNLSMDPAEITVSGDIVYFDDEQYHAIRALDLTTGQTEFITEDDDDERPFPSSCAAEADDRTSVDTALICHPAQMTVRGGLIFITDSAHDVIYRVWSGSGRVEVVAGTTPYKGSSFDVSRTDDGMRAKEVQLVNPFGIAVDQRGRIFFSEPSQDRIRMIDPEGRVWTVAGMRRAINAGLGSTAVSTEGCVEETNGDEHVCAGEDTLDGPRGLALDQDGHLLIADSRNGRIAKLVLDELPRLVTRGGVGDPHTGVATPSALTGTLTTVASGESLRFPSELSLDANGELFVLNEGNVSDSVVKLAPQGSPQEPQVIYTGPEDGIIDGIAAVGGQLLVTEADEADLVDFDAQFERRGPFSFSGPFVDAPARLFSIGPDQTKTQLATNGLYKYGGDEGPALDAQMNYVSDVVYDNFGSYYLLDAYNDVLRKVDCEGVIHRDYEVGKDALITADKHANVYVREGVVQESGDLGQSHDSPPLEHRLTKLSPDGIATTLYGVWPGGEMVTDQPDLYNQPSDITVRGILIDELGRFWFTADHQVFRFDPAAPEGKQYDVIAGNGSAGYGGDNGPAKLGELEAPQGLSLDDEGNLFIADTGNNRIRRWDVHSREITTAVGTDDNELLDRLAQADFSHLDPERGQDVFLSIPADVAYDSQRDELWILDSGNRRLLQAHRNRMSTVDGDGGIFGISLTLDIDDARLVPRVRGGLTFTSDKRGPQGITLGEPGSVVFADSDYDRATAVLHPNSEGAARCAESPAQVQATSLSLSAPQEAQHTDAVPASAQLLLSDGSPVAGETVTFTLGTTSVDAVTDLSGVASASISASDVPGTYKLSAAFAATETKEGSLAESPFTIVREATALTYSGDTTASSDTVRLAAMLLDDDGSGVTGKTITFTVAGQSFTAVSDATGLAETTVTISKHAKQEQVLATFPEDGSFTGSSGAGTITWSKKG